LDAYGVSPTNLETGNDHNPQRIARRSLFDLAAGHDSVFHGDRYKWSVRVTVINVADKVALLQLPLHL